MSTALYFACVKYISNVSGDTEWFDPCYRLIMFMILKKMKHMSITKVNIWTDFRL